MSNLVMRHTNVFKRNFDAYNDPNVRFLVNQGGSRSSKTYSICQLILWYALTNSFKTVSVCRKTGPALFASVYVDFLGILHEYEIYDSLKVNKTTGTFLFPNGTKVRFFSIDNPQKLRGRKHDLVFLNEANELTLEEFTQINMRTTGKIILDWNPSDPFSWVLDLKKDPLTREIHSTFKDNPFLEPAIVREIENLINNDETYYQIYALGLLPTGKSIVFPNLFHTPFPSTIDHIYGMDFGYNDPNVIVKVGQDDGRLYIKEELFESYLTTEQLIEKMDAIGISKSHMIFADSARPDQIKSIANAGYSIQGGNKKISEGIDYMKTLQIHIDPSSENVHREFRSYMYKKVHGIVTDTPVDFANHTIDAARYAAISMKGNFSTSFFVL